MVVLIDDLLDVARIERGEIRLRLERIDLRTPLRLAIEACNSFMGSRGQCFEEVGFDRPIIAMADPTRVAQMASNLLNNAAKYTPPRGHIRLELSQRDAWAEICVIDDGVGLDPTALERVFNMFEQVEKLKGASPRRFRHWISSHTSTGAASWWVDSGT
jgi:signal transduction histidine kinase